MRWLGRDALMIKLAISPASERAEKPGEFAACDSLDGYERGLVCVRGNQRAEHGARMGWAAAFRREPDLSRLGAEQKSYK